MPTDRDATLRQAETFRRDGRTDLAIAAYVRLVEAQPRDWTSINALGDLYLKAGDIDRAVARFVQIGDHLLGEGFLAKAAAVYKKALKARPNQEHALSKLADIAAAQELFADARVHLRRLWDFRSTRGDDRGAAECLVRLAGFPDADVETMLTGAHAARGLGDAASAAELLRRVVGEYVAAGRIEEAGRLLDAESAGTDPELLLLLASVEFRRRNDAPARAALTRVMGLAPGRFSDVLRLAGELGRDGEPHRAFACADVVVDDAVLRSDWDRAIEVLRSFLAHGEYVPALAKLVGVLEAAGAGEALLEAQERLVQAYLAAGHAAEPQAAAEALLAGSPGSAVHTERLRRAIELAGTGDADAAVSSAVGRIEGSEGRGDAGPADLDLSRALDTLREVNAGADAEWTDDTVKDLSDLSAALAALREGGRDE